ncbi:hypothetical protein Ddc_05307 [Ditylenchus destructor]|nr:hypothetical protein Ddc_05307 [Ditylenchus destructor]
MPPKRSKPIAPMVTRSRTKAKKNAEPEAKVDAKRYRKDTMQVADEDGSAHGNGGESDNGPAETPFRPVKDNLNYTIANAIQVLNEMYDKWLTDNTRSSTADTSINAFIDYCKMTFDDLEKVWLWLKENQRVEPEEIEFLEALTKLGDGELQDKDEGEFEFPEECISDNVLQDVYDNSTTNLPNRVITWNFLHFLQEMPSLLNKRAPSSSARGVRELAVGTLGHLSLGTSHRQIIFFTFPWMMRMRAAHFLDRLILSHIAIMYFSYGSSTFAPLARFFCALNLQFSAHLLLYILSFNVFTVCK